MDRRINLRNLEARVTSGDLAIQVAALEDAKEMIETISNVAAQGFKYTENPLIYADRLSSMGQAIVPYLEALYATYELGQPKTILAILLLYLGKNTGLRVVINALCMQNPNHLLAAIRLANAGITEAVEPITSLMKEYAFTQPLEPAVGPKIGTLISALAKLGAGVPADVRDRLKAPDISEYIAAYLPDEWGRPTHNNGGQVTR